MGVDKKDFDELIERRMKEQQERLAARAKMEVRQAKVNEQFLTGDARWDKYLSFVQPMLDDATRLAQDAAVNVMKPDLNEDGIRYCRQMFSYAKGRQEALKEAMEIPKRLVEEAESAAKRVDDAPKTMDSLKLV